MQTFNKITWIVVSALAVAVPALFFAGFLSLGSLITNGLLVLLLAAAAVSTSLLKNASRILKYAGLACAWTGWLIFALALQHFVALSAVWQLGLFLLSAGLICGIFAVQSNTSKRLRWTAIAASILMLPVIVGILSGIENAFFYQFGTIVLIIFSITAMLAALQPSVRQ